MLFRVAKAPKTSRDAKPGVSTPDRTSRRGGQRLLAQVVVAFVVAAMALLVGGNLSPAAAQLNPAPRNADGVAGLDSQSGPGTPIAEVWTIEQIGNRIYVGGRFQQVVRANGSQVNQQFLAAFSASTGEWISSFRPNLNGPVWSIEATPNGNQLLVGGKFTQVNGQSRNSFVALNSSGAISNGYSLQVGGNSSAVTVRDVHVDSDGFVYLGGFFTTASDSTGSFAASSVLRASANSGVIDRSWRPRVQGGTVRGIDADAGRNRVYLVGFFNSVNGSADTANFAVVNHSGGATNGVNNPFPLPSPEGLFDTTFHYDVLATGNFVWVAGSEHTLWTLNANDLSVFGWHYTGFAQVGPGGGDFQAIERVGNTIYASCHCGVDIKSSFTGGFTGQSQRVRLAMAFNATTARYDASYQPEFRGRAGPWAIKAASDGCVWFGGDMTQAGGRSVNALVRQCPDNGGGGGGGAAVAPASCSASANGGSAINVTWNRAGNDNASRFIVERSRNGGSFLWAGTNSGTSFNNTGVRAGTYRYRVVTVAGNGSRATRTCSPTGGVTLGGGGGVQPLVGGGGGGAAVRAVASCFFRRSGNDVLVTWTPADRDGASRYIVERSRNGGAFFWAGRVDAPGRSFTNVSPNSGTYTYRVRAVGSGNTSDARTCGSSNGGITF